MNVAPRRWRPFTETEAPLHECLLIKKWRIDFGKEPKTPGNDERGKREELRDTCKRTEAKCQLQQLNKDIQWLEISCYLHNCLCDQKAIRPGHATVLLNH